MDQPSIAVAAGRQFLEVARDPRLIPGVHHFCDEWCERCSLTQRCLSFRCTSIYRRLRSRADGQATFRSTGEALAFTRALGGVEGLEPAQIESLVSASVEASGFRISDPLPGVAWEYATSVSLWLVFLPEELRQMRVDATPSPAEVVLWFHMRIYLKLVRALIARDRRRAGRPVLRDEADGCAKLTLVSVQRSRRALMQLRTATNADTIARLITLLDRLERGIDEGFPKARAFVRPGIDVPV